MGKSYRTRCRGREDKVIQSVKEIGISGTMALYGFKTRSYFIAWLEKEQAHWQDFNPIAGMRPMEIKKWRKEHRETILDCLEVFGADWVKSHFHFAHDNLERFVKFNHQPFTGNRKLTRLERAELDSREAIRLARQATKEVNLFLDRLAIVDEGFRAEKHTVIELHEAYSSFTESVSNQLSHGIGQFIRTMLETSIKPNENLPAPKKQDLDIEKLVGDKARLKLGAIQSTPDNRLLETVVKIEAGERG